MRIHARAPDARWRASGGRITAVAGVAGVLWLAGCAGGPTLELADSHPASPRAAAAATMTASAALAAYRTPQDFAARLATQASAPEAEGHGAAHGGGATQVAQANAPAPGGVGTVNAVNPETRTVNVSHEPIPSLGWPAMTMDFPVAPAVDLGRVRPGTRVRFTLRRGADGMYAIDSLTPGPASGASQSPAGGAPGMEGHGNMPGMGSGSSPQSGGHQ